MSRVEIVGIIIVIVLLGQLLGPAINRWRENAHRSQCVGNLQLLGKALQQFHEGRKQFPCAVRCEGQKIDFTRFPFAFDTIPETFENWSISLLSHMDQEVARDAFDISKTIVAVENERGRGMAIRELICPSDSHNTLENRFEYSNQYMGKVAFARGNYALNGGTQFVMKGPGNLMDPRPLTSTFRMNDHSREFQWWGEGIGGFNKSFSMKEFSNGLSRTVAINEIRAGIHPSDCRGVWALGQIGSSVTWGHGIMSDAGGPNPKLENADDILNGSTIHQVIGRERIREEGMTFCDHCDYNTQAGSRSMHPGGVNLVFCDGRVRFITDDVDQSIWHAMHSRNTPKDVLADISDETITGTQPLKRRELIDDRLVVAKVDAGQRPLVNSLQMTFSPIPAGTFMMGIPDEGAAHNYPEDVPAHEVNISRPFYIGQFEVTQTQYKEIMGNNPSSFVDGNASGKKLSDMEVTKRPVENVSWNDAVDFCQKLSGLAAEKQAGRTYRLPTEAEWEYCCRSGSSQPYRFNGEWRDGDDSGEIARKVQRKDPPATMPVGSYRPNVFGLYDMRGNVWEWCRDWFQHDYYSWSSRSDPQGPASGILKVYRGCDWIYSGDDCKTANRCLAPEGKSPFIGFRVVCELVNPEKSP